MDDGHGARGNGLARSEKGLPGDRPLNWPPFRVLVVSGAALAPFAYGVFRLARAGEGGRQKAALALMVGVFAGAAIAWGGRRYLGARALSALSALKGSLSNLSNALLIVALLGVVAFTYAPLREVEAGMGLLSGIVGFHAARAFIAWWPHRVEEHAGGERR